MLPPLAAAPLLLLLALPSLLLRSEALDAESSLLRVLDVAAPLLLALLLVLLDLGPCGLLPVDDWLPECPVLVREAWARVGKGLVADVHAACLEVLQDTSTCTSLLAAQPLPALWIALPLLSYSVIRRHNHFVSLALAVVCTALLHRHGVPGALLAGLGFVLHSSKLFLHSPILNRLQFVKPAKSLSSSFVLGSHSLNAQGAVNEPSSATHYDDTGTTSTSSSSSNKALKSAHHHIASREQQAPEDVSTLIKNAMRISYPNNALHGTKIEAKIKGVLQRLPESIVAKMKIAGDNLQSDSLGSLSLKSQSLLLDRVRSIRLLAGSINGKPCIIKTLVDAETLEEEDYDLLMRTIASATGLPAIPYLRPTLGCCWIPATMIAEEPCSFQSFRQVVLELRGKGVNLDWELFRPLAICIAQVLVALHDHGVCHRELCISTIALTSFTTVSVAPIGFLHTIPEARRKILGNLIPVAPEVAMNRGSGYTSASDVWSLSVVCLEMLMGTVADATPIAMPATVPKRVAEFIFDAFKSDPEARPSAREMLNVFAAEEGVVKKRQLHSLSLFRDICKRLDESSFSAQAPLVSSIESESEDPHASRRGSTSELDKDSLTC